MYGRYVALYRLTREGTVYIYCRERGRDEKESRQGDGNGREAGERGGGGGGESERDPAARSERRSSLHGEEGTLGVQLLKSPAVASSPSTTTNSMAAGS
ncbi:hypothetical protein BHE74_00026858 [Ensete ventricosum]|nr:hypothetical protein GW17_00013418 [Ensete ventricosum]RWW65808.1 hypothetical protein BHE74_00026858 [Ensete ventricosum]RZR99012.1 hypothetical protein BHM03_00028481 [Ensete ventricosum]